MGLLMRLYTMLRAACEACSGKGWTLRGVPGKDWPEPCKTCLGQGKAPTLAALARAIDEDPSTLYRLDRVKVGGEIATRLFDKLTTFIAERPGLA